MAFGLRVPILKVRYFDPDEFQHLHGARQIYHGDVPYRDYFEHHTPFLHFVLAKFYPVFGEEVRILFAARVLMMVFTAAILCGVFILAAMLYGIDAGLFATLFLSYIIMFLEKTIEVRPDLPAVTFWLAALIFMVRGIQRNSDSPSSRWHLFSGLCMGMAIMSTQKALFAFGGIGLSLLWTLADRRLGGSIKHRLKLAFVFLGGMMIPIALVCLYFLAHRGLWQFINCNFIMNSRWKVTFSPYNYIKQLLRQNPFISVISILGLLIATVRMWRKEGVINGNFVPVLPAYVLIAGLFIMPVPYRQYYMLFLPLLAVYCGALFKHIAAMDVRFLTSTIRKPQGRLLSFILILLALALLTVGLFYTLRFSKPIIFDSRSHYLLLWAILLISVIVALVFKWSAYAALVISLGIIASPLEQTVDQRLRKNDGQLATAEFIMNATSPDDAVLDGWSGPGFLRDHAYFYFFLHGEMRAMLTQKQLSDDLIESVEKKQAKIIVYDAAIKALPKKVKDYIAANYAPSGHGNIHIRK
ncbi:ArnT family glycosyltransferase [Candidatus Poribacteria bacterium]